MTTLQIVLLAVAGAFALASIAFMVMFILEITVEHKEKVEEQPEIKSVFSSETYNTVVVNETKEASVDEMLAKLDEDTKEEETPAVDPVAERVIEEETVAEEIVEETVEEEKQEEVVEEVKEEVKEEVVEEVKPEPVETKKTVKEEAIENLAEIDESADDSEDDEDGELELLSDITEIKNDTHETIKAGSIIDYKARLDKIIETRNKIERDLTKIQKSILKYERTKRRKNRNQKMLDRRAGELTNLNLVMYSVTDIKNVDEDKKVKQEELTAHIAELKASIQDAEEFIESNKEKNDHNVKMAKFLLQEKARYNEEINELQALIDSTEDTSVSA
ncbi:MAG: hypothetical protein J6A51_04685 [Clostridia bacterium]|nr:hypothetical protein [Clostridia bacterium]